MQFKNTKRGTNMDANELEVLELQIHQRAKQGHQEILHLVFVSSHDGETRDLP
ncbi:hypothetical protein NHP21005_10040 [Helicobacter sp. NHP21005]|uniref:hypothetical protein n=1 Tax=Helicobacter felistomachi TaxID=3040201 RepID=UPI002572C082|nr:hypothetical protein [Helicobacter sp. NHP21005]BEG57316.1 hypothetical protein NHP21005_10040 [Helicobacter sp. NHP21005]